MALESTEPLTEMGTMNLPGDEVRSTRKAENLTAICEPNSRTFLGASTSHNLMDLHGLLPG
jgi:hypothetical protein